MDEKQNISENKRIFIEKIIYFFKFAFVFIVGFTLYSFLIFYVSRKIEGLGIFLFVVWIFSILGFNAIIAPIVYMDVKKIQTKGIDTKNTALGWALIVLAYPFVGISWYLSNRIVDYKKQLLNLR